MSGNFLNLRYKIEQLENKLKPIFVALTLDYSSDRQLIAKLWNEIEKAHSAEDRYYHTLAHLEHLFAQLNTIKSSISDWNTILFTLFYHDFVYEATSKENEGQSAVVARECMQLLGVPADMIERCRLQILATKSHQLSDNPDTNLFTDADLSVLGSDWDMYEVYYKQVRQEYNIYPDVVYCPGRKKVLEHFLAMERIFKTAYFYRRYEDSARRNLTMEIGKLEGEI